MKTVRLLLTENVDNLGIVGDVVDVKPGYARNFLRPMGLATQPTEGNIQRLAERRAEVEKELRELRARLEVMFEKLEGYELTIERSCNEQGVLYGGVSQHDIAEAMREEGYDIEDRAVRIGERIERVDSYTIPLALDHDLKTEIKLWVVSDKPMEQLEIGDEEEEGAEAEGEAAEGAEVEAKEGEAEETEAKG